MREAEICNPSTIFQKIIHEAGQGEWFPVMYPPQPLAGYVRLSKLRDY